MTTKADPLYSLWHIDISLRLIDGANIGQIV